jgi:hypothetical protein
MIMLPIYHALKNIGAEIDNHYSDLHVKADPKVVAVLSEYKMAKKTKVFRSRIDGSLWYEIPFAFLPWWEKQEERSSR